jgi:hypothetical protein
MMKSQGSTTRPRGKANPYFGDLESRTFDAKPGTAFSAITDNKPGSKASSRQKSMFSWQKVQYNPTILNSKFRSSHGVYMDTMSDRMELDGKLRRKKLLPGPTDY